MDFPPQQENSELLFPGQAESKGAGDEQSHPLLSVCIPTYNRAVLLNRCLESVLPQIEGKPVEVVVIDNASDDNTEDVVRKYVPGTPGLRYFRNSANLGFFGSQVKCLEYGRGKYTAILCDDDLYTPAAIDVLLRVLTGKDFCFVAINYYSFLSNPEKVYQVLAPETDLLYEDAYKILDFPSVGHYSGMVFNSLVAREALARVLQIFSEEQFGRFRGVLGAVAVMTTKSSQLPGYFIGRRILAAGAPPAIEYENLSHICMDTWEFFSTMVKAGILSDADVSRRREDTLNRLPKALIRNGGDLSAEKLSQVSSQLNEWFGGDPRFASSARILRLLKLPVFRFGIRAAVRCYKFLRKQYVRVWS